MKDAYYFPHDYNAKDDPKCTMLIEELGLEGYGIFWVLIEILREQPNYKYPLKLLPSIARKYATTTEKVKVVVERYELFKIENDAFFFSESLNRRMMIYQEKREQARLAGIASAEQRKKKALMLANKNNDSSTDVQRQFNDSSTDVQPRKEKKVKEIKEIKENNLIICESVYETYLKNFSKKGNKKKSFDYIERIILKKKYEITDFQRILKNYFLEHEKQYPLESDFLKYAKEPQNFFSESNGYWEQFDVKE